MEKECIIWEGLASRKTCNEVRTFAEEEGNQNTIKLHVSILNRISF